MYGDVIVEGEGPAVVMAHGTMMDCSMFAPQIDALKRDYRVISYSQRARTARFDEPYFLKDLAEDCRELLDDQGIGRCVLVGMSMGGFMATEFISRYPGRVNALVLIGSQIGTYSESEQAARMIEFQKFAHDGNVSLPLARETASYIFGDRTLRDKAALVHHWTHRWSELPARSVLREAESWLGKSDYTAVARRFDKPVLVIHGEDDIVLPVDDKTGAMEKAFSDVEIVRVPHSGHVVNLEAPEQTNEALRTFLDRLKQDGRLGS